MKKSLFVAALLAVGVFVLCAGVASAQATKEPQAQTTCPVMGGNINKDIFVDAEGYRVYLCCPACVDKFKADPKGYIKKLQDEGVAVAKPQTVCPVEGKPVDKNVYVDCERGRIYFCCVDCARKFKTDCEPYMKQMKDQGIVLDPAPKDAKCGAAETKGGCPSTGAGKKKPCCAK